jgi:hypothetical protein
VIHHGRTGADPTTPFMTHVCQVPGKGGPLAIDPVADHESWRGPAFDVASPVAPVRVRRLVGARGLEPLTSAVCIRFDTADGVTIEGVRRPDLGEQRCATMPNGAIRRE